MMNFKKVLCKSQSDQVLRLYLKCLPLFQQLGFRQLQLHYGQTIDLIFLDIRNRHMRSSRLRQEKKISKWYVLSEVLKFLDAFIGCSLDLYGLPSPPQNLAPLDAPQEEEENVFENILFDAIEAVAKFNWDQKHF